MSFARSAVALISGTALGQLFLVVSTPVVSHLYTPSTIGIFALYLAYINLLQTVASLMYCAAIPAASNEADAVGLTQLSFRLSWATSAASAAAFWLLIRLNLGGFGALPQWAPAIGFASLILTSRFTIIRFYLVRQQNFNAIAGALTLQGAARSTVQIALGVVAPSWISLAAADLAGRSFGVARNYGRIRRRIRDAPAVGMRALASRYRAYPLFFLPSTIIDTAVVLLPIPAITVLYGPREAGYFAIVGQALALPLGLIATSVADVFHGRISQIVRDGTSAARLFWRTFRLLIVIGVSVALVIVTLGPWLFTHILGSRWRTAGLMASIMAPWFVAQFVVSPLSRLLIVFDGQRIKLLYDLAALGVLATAVAVAATSHFMVLDFVRLLTWLNVGVYTFYFCLIRLVAQRNEPQCAE